MSNIYQIQQELLSIFDTIEENEGEITPELEEKLSITKDSFKDKIESYTNVIKSLNNDIDAIKAEKLRLNDLQKSKEKTIERLKKIIIEAVDLFGDSNKSGNKFIDYGTGKISIRTNQVLEIDDDATSRFINRFVDCMTYINLQNQLQRNICSIDELLDYANSKSPAEMEEGIERPIFNIDDIKQLNTNINLDISIQDILNTDKGFDLLKALINYNCFEMKPKINKIDIKREAKESNVLPVFAKLVDNKSVTIK